MDMLAIVSGRYDNKLANLFVNKLACQSIIGRMLLTKNPSSGHSSNF